jgi:hypothetical protein
MQNRTPFRLAAAAAAWLVVLGATSQAQEGVTELETLLERQARAKVEAGVRGNIYANCDDAFVLLVNGKKVAEGKWPRTPPPRPLKLCPGDLITVRAGNGGGAWGFGMIYRSFSKKAAFSTNTRDWYYYAPANPDSWWELGDFDQLDKKPATAGSQTAFKGQIEQQSGAVCEEAIWGDPGQTTVYLVRRVTHEDVMDK